MMECEAVLFAMLLCSVGPPSLALVAFHIERGGMLLHNAVGITREKCATTDTNRPVPSVWANGCCSMVEPV